MLARIYGIQPGDLDNLSIREIEEFLIDLDRLLEDHARQQRN